MNLESPNELRRPAEDDNIACARLLPEQQPDAHFRKLGLLVGLEIHQQLDTAEKLFCRCPTGYHNESAQAEILRHMRPTLSEMGTYDRTALMEFRTHKQVHYQIHFGSTCSYEIDDTPPFPMNRQALEQGLKGTLLFDCSLVNEVHISRKQYLDGSIPTGFQRTAILGIEGTVKVNADFSVPISHCCLEEDACREVSDLGHDIVFRTDRLGTPLLEVITQATPMPPSMAQATAAAIGHQLRWARLARRGSGATRQDVNVSITGGDRVEIKGVNHYQLISRLVAREAYRQQRLLALKERLEQNGGSKDDLSRELIDCTAYFSKTNWEPLATTLALEHPLPDVGTSEYDAPETEMGQAIAVVLTGWKGLLDWEVQPGLSFANELAGRIRVIACIQAPYLLRPGQFVSLGVITSAELVALKNQLKLNADDSYVVVWGSQSDAKTAAEEVLTRCRQAYEGIPQETRQVLNDGNTDFERVLPGPDRMYPDTDSRPIQLSSKLIDEYQTSLPISLNAVREELKEQGLPNAWVDRLPLSLYWDIYKLSVEKGVKPRLVGWTCLELTRDLERKGFDISKLKVEESKHSPLFLTLMALKAHPGGRDLMADWLKALSTGDRSLEQLDGELAGLEIPDPVVLISNHLKGHTPGKGSLDQARRIIAKIMLANRGRVSGAEVARLVYQRMKVTP